MKRVFQVYGKYYDLIYLDKDYEKECDFLEEVFRKYSMSMPRKILDAGCGTGGHAIPLAKRGYEVTGVDVSETMIQIAKEKAHKSKVVVNFYTSDLQELSLNEKFDACICMFAVIGYLIKNESIKRVLYNIRRHINNGSLFIFDFWYGPAVLTILPSTRVKTIEKDRIRLIRIAKPHLDTFHHICDVNYHLIVTKENIIVDEVKERHVVRFFFPEEIGHYLEESNFEVLELCQFPRLGVKPSEQTWNVVAICMAV